MRSRDIQDGDRRPAPPASSGSASADEAARLRRLEEPKAPVSVYLYLNFLDSTQILYFYHPEGV